LVFFCASILCADIPSPRLDGSWGKGPAYKDPYNYSKLDYDKVRQNPYNIIIKERINRNDSGFHNLKSNLENLEKWDVTDKKLRSQYVKEVKTEYDLNEKEKQTAQAYPNMFPNEAKTGKRVYVSNVMKLGEKEYSVNNCTFFGKGDMNGDGIPEIFIRHSDNATHAGAQSQIQVFSENGDFVCYIYLETLFMGMHKVYDYDGDGLVELIYMPKHKEGEFIVLSCAKEGKEYEPFKMGGGQGLFEMKKSDNLELSPLRTPDRRKSSDSIAPEILRDEPINLPSPPGKF
jgi:hypothetical protein